MTRNLKLLELAVVAILAMGAVATSASADHLTAEKNPVNVTSKDSGLGLTFSFTAGTVKCKEASYTAISVVTPTTAVTTTPSYPVKTVGGEQNCTGFGFPAEINTNGCTYTYTIGGGGATTGGLDLNCPAGQEITVTAKSAGVVKCTVHMPAQIWGAGVTLSNMGSGTTSEIDVTTSIVSAFAYKHTAGTGVGACTSGTSSTGNYTATSIWTGENGSNQHIGIFVS